jgi:hypothetical protein
MAQPTTARFGAFIVSLESANSPSVYVAPCGFTSKSLTLSKNLAEVAIPDCDDPDAPFYIARDVQTQSWSISGEGLLASESVDAWLDAYNATTSTSVQIEIDMGVNKFTLVGDAHLDNWSISTEQGGRVSVSISMQSDGAPTITFAP